MTSGSDIAFASAEALVELYRNKALSPVEAADMLLGRAEALQPRLNAFCFLNRDGALAAARASELCARRSRDRCGMRRCGAAIRGARREGGGGGRDLPVAT